MGSCHVGTDLEYSRQEESDRTSNSDDACVENDHLTQMVISKTIRCSPRQDHDKDDDQVNPKSIHPTPMR